MFGFTRSVAWYLVVWSAICIMHEVTTRNRGSITIIPLRLMSLKYSYCLLIHKANSTCLRDGIWNVRNRYLSFCDRNAKPYIFIMFFFFLCLIKAVLIIKFSKLHYYLEMRKPLLRLHNFINSYVWSNRSIFP